MSRWRVARDPLRPLPAAGARRSPVQEPPPARPEAASEAAASELTEISGIAFADLPALDLVGIYPNYAEAYQAWRAAAQRSVDNAHVRYFIVHIHRLIDPEGDARR
jgi:Domain of unknown function (DUF4170)